MSKPTNIPEQLPEDNHLSLQQMQAYLEDTIPHKQMHQIEKHLLDCELCADAMEGLTFIEPGKADESVNDLKRKVRKRSLREPVRKRKKKPVPLLWRHMSVAAATIILVAGSILVFKLNSPKKQVQPVLVSKESTIPSAPVSPEVSRQQAPAYSDALPMEEEINSSNRNTAGNTTKPNLRASNNEALEEKIVTESDAGLAPEVAVDQIEEQLIEEQLKDKEVIASQEQESLQQVPQTVVAEAKREETRQEVLKSKSAPVPSSVVGITQNFITINGKVALTSDTTAFLPGVKVTIKGTNKSVLTDYRGRFSLAVPPKSTLVFSMEGMNNSEVTVNDRKTIQVLLMREGEMEEFSSNESMEEVLEEDNLSYKPQPEKGLMSYRNYLKKNLKYPNEAIENKVQGNVRVEFTVKPDGQMSDFAIRKGLGFGCDEEALRLVKEGPAWKPAIANGKKVERRITVYVPFKL